MSFASAGTVGRIVAVVNDEVITSVELEEALTQVSPLERGSGLSEEDLRRKVLDRIIEQRLILQKAKQVGVAVSTAELDQAIEMIRSDFPSQQEFEAQLARQGLTLERFRLHYRNQMIIKRMVDREVRNRVLLSPKELAAYYTQHHSDFKEPERLHLWTLLIRHREGPKEDRKARTLAHDLHRQIRQGDSFEALARRYSEGPQKEAGGDLGWVEPQNLLQEIQKAVGNLQVGELSPVIESAMGYHLFKLAGKKGEEVLPLRKAKPLIERRLWEEKMRREYRRWVGSLKAEAYLEIY